MEFEIEEFASSDWLDDGAEAVLANHAPRWCADRTGGEHTGVWNPEESFASDPSVFAPH